jgi:uncharacterized protein (TIGR02145 family)
MKFQRQIVRFLTLLIIISGGCNKNEEQAYDEIRFNSKLDYGFVTDIDGNTYRTIQIGTQVWMAENLKVAHYRDGKAISLVQSSVPWQTLNSEGYSTYAFGYEIYGFLYNYYAAVNTHNICPTGWHLPENSDWTTLASYSGGEQIAGNNLKETGPVHWGYYNTLSTNKSGFTALPGGLRDHLGDVYSTGNSEGGASYWWSSNVNDSVSAWSFSLGSEVSMLLSTPRTLKRNGFNIRCVKD